jgi:hypothetical protein
MSSDIPKEKGGEFNFFFASTDVEIEVTDIVG